MPNYDPLLTEEEFEELHRQLDAKRKGLVKVDRDALDHLLQDHSKLWEKLGIT